MRYHKLEHNSQININHLLQNNFNTSSHLSSVFKDYLKWPLIGMISFAVLGIIIYAIYNTIKKSNLNSVQTAYQQPFSDYSGLKPTAQNLKNKKQMLQSVTWKLDTAGKGRK